MSGRYNFVLQKNAVFRKRLRYMTRARKGINLTGYTAILQAKVALTDPTPVIDWTTLNGGITLSALGHIDLYMELAAIQALSFDTAQYDLLLIPPSGEPIRLLEGTLTVSAGVSKP